VAKHHRRSIRMKDYDYSQPGAYFVTLSSYGRDCLFGEIVDGVMILSPSGKIGEQEWLRLERRSPTVTLDEVVIMPDHLHGIIMIQDKPTNEDALLQSNQMVTRQQEEFGKPVPGSIPTIIRSFKSSVTLRVNHLRGTKGARVWHRNYYEHIIRSEAELKTVRKYIRENPARFDLGRGGHRD
jgi:putative transposase